MLIMHGASYAALKVEVSHGQSGSSRWANRSAGPDRCILTLAGLWLANGIEGLRITSVIDGNGPSNPLLKTVHSAPRAPGSTTSGVIRLCGLLR